MLLNERESIWLLLYIKIGNFFRFVHLIIVFCFFVTERIVTFVWEIRESFIVWTWSLPIVYFSSISFWPMWLFKKRFEVFYFDIESKDHSCVFFVYLTGSVFMIFNFFLAFVLSFFTLSLLEFLNQIQWHIKFRDPTVMWVVITNPFQKIFNDSLES